LITGLDARLQPKLALLGLGQSFHFGNVRDALANVEGSEKTLFLIVWQYVRTSGDMMTTVIGDVVLMPLVLFYLLYDRHQMFRRMESMVPRRWLGKTREFVIEMDRMLLQYLRGQLLVMGVLAVFYPIALSIAGFEIALPLGILTGLAAVAIIYGTGQILESFFPTPHFVGERISLHPLAVIFALFAFGQLFGFFGVLLALPVSAIIATALRELRRRYLATALYKL
jgi:predicted PurR-regulated permease PerM